MADIKVLMVADGAYFGYGPQLNFPEFNWFALTHLVSTLRNSTSPTIQVDTAHRCGNLHKGGTMTTPDTSIGLTYQGDFTFVATPNTAATPNNVTADLSQYDVLWLMAYEGYDYGYPNPVPPPSPGASPLTDPERIAIANFMNAGGGVFAVGDHDGLGGFMCDKLLRVRTMRKWHVWGDPTNLLFAPNWSVDGPAVTAPGQPDSGQTDRFDSLRADANGTGNFYFDDQSDRIPQPTLNQNGDPLATSPGPIHSLLRDADGAVIAWWPDHMHEGEATDLTTVSPTGTPLDPNDGSGNPVEIAYTDAGGASVSFPEFPSLGGYQPLPEAIVYGNDLGHPTIEYAGSTPDPTTGAKTAAITSTTPGVGKVGGKVSVYDGRGVGVGRIVTGASFHHYIDLNLLGNTGSEALYAAPEPTDTSDGLQGVVLNGSNVLAAMDAYYINTVVWLARQYPSFGFWTVKSTYGADEVAAVAAPGFTDAFFLVLDGFTPAVVGSNPAVTLSGPFKTTGGAVLVQQAAIFDASHPNTAQRILIPFTVQSIPTGSGSAFPQPGNPPVTLALEAQVSIGTPLFAEALFELTAGEDPYFVNVDPGADNAFWLSQDLRVFQVVPGIGAPPFGIAFAAGDTGYDYITALLAYLNGDAAFTSGASDPFQTLMEMGDLTEASSISPQVVTGAGVRPAYNFAVARVRLSGSGTAGKTASGVKVFFRLFTTATNDTDYDPQTTYLSTYDAAGFPDRPLPGLNGTSFPLFATLGGADDYDVAAPINERSISVDAGGESWAFFGCYLDVYGVSSPPPALVGTHHCLVAQIAYDDAPIVAAAGLTLSPENCDKLAQRNIEINAAAG